MSSKVLRRMNSEIITNVIACHYLPGDWWLVEQFLGRTRLLGEQR